MLSAGAVRDSYMNCPDQDKDSRPRFFVVSSSGHLGPENVPGPFSSPGNEPTRRSSVTRTEVRSSLGVIASAGVVRDTHVKTAHKVIIWGVYVWPTFRRRGLGRAVMQAAIDAASSWPGIDRLTLSASADSPEAIGLYESMGFTRWGEEPDAMRMDGASFDEVHLSKGL